MTSKFFTNHITSYGLLCSYVNPPKSSKCPEMKNKQYLNVGFLYEECILNEEISIHIYILWYNITGVRGAHWWYNYQISYF